MEECFLANKATLTKPSGGSFTLREMDIISSIINGGTLKSTGKLLGISPNTVNNHITNIRSDLHCNSMDQIVKFVESSDGFIAIRERYIDLLLFNKFEDALKKINALEISQKYKCIVHANVEEIDKYILLNYLKLSGIKVDISYDAKEYAYNQFHIICYPARSEINLESLSADNVVVSENHRNNLINLRGECIESNGSGTQYESYSSLLGCISKIYSSENIDDILNNFREYYYKIKDRKSSAIPKQNHIKITDKRRYVMLFSITFIMLLIMSAITYWYTHRRDETHKTVLATNINILIGEDIFLKRRDLVSKMDKILEKQRGVKFLVLVGQGGIGKTTLARHYVRVNDAKIKWEINAATEESTIKSFLALAIELSQKQYEKREELKYIQAIEDQEMKKQGLISFVFSQLKDNSEWCILFDNVDDFKMIHAFLPSNRDSCGEGAMRVFN